ncbi:hypothetical protein ANO11243_094470 [Dothideomycetidae sp. 11243]|nr:hypothetical protein ANO11243_094470 [fungal sp. No.11243]
MLAAFALTSQAAARSTTEKTDDTIGTRAPDIHDKTDFLPSNPPKLRLTRRGRDDQPLAPNPPCFHCSSDRNWPCKCDDAMLERGEKMQVVFWIQEHAMIGGRPQVIWHGMGPKYKQDTQTMTAIVERARGQPDKLQVLQKPGSTEMTVVVRESVRDKASAMSKLEKAVRVAVGRENEYVEVKLN